MESTESPLKRKVTIIPPTLRFITHVAIYCRVSSDSKEQLNSLANQISFLTQYVYQNAQWRLVDIYIDIHSGRDTASRSEFERMMNDCAMNKIEKIVTKSISRFGRNTVDTLDAINTLRTLGVDVYFQNENLSSLSGDNSFLISLIEAIAQEESVQRSENIRWGIVKRAKDGKGEIFLRTCFGYGRGDDGNLRIIEVEADIVRMIFDWYLQGFSVLAIRKELHKLSIKSPTGQENWSKRTIETMLENEKYAGDVLAMKTFTEPYPNRKRKTNKGKYDRFVFERHHPAIIPKDVFEQVRATRLERSNVVVDESGKARKSTRYSMKKAKQTEGETADLFSETD